MVEQDLAVASDVAWGPAGLVVVGQLGFPEDRVFSGTGERPAAWFSTDGLAWDPLPGDTFVDNEADTVWLAEIAVQGEEFVISGFVDEEPRAWSSTDGRSWVEATDSVPSMDIIPVLGERVDDLLIGLDEGQVWASDDDGSTWDIVGVLSEWEAEGVDVTVVVAVGSQLVIGGTVETETGFRAAVWIADLEATAIP